MKILLNNGSLTAEIESKGAELRSLICGGTERIWSGRPEVWGRRSPLLFPLIGRLMDGIYQYEGQTIQAPMHGFCRDRLFTVEEQTDTLVRLSTTEDSETLAVYPFAFKLTVEFELQDHTLIKRHIVENRSDKLMPFEVGGHDAYATAILPGESRRDYVIEFEGADYIEPFGMEDGTGMAMLPKSRVELKDHCLTLLPEDLGLDTIMVEGLPVRRATLKCPKNDLRVTVDFADFDYLGIWTMPREDAEYICIEPWSTLPDGHFMTRNILERPGIQTLQPGQSKALTYTETFA